MLVDRNEVAAIKDGGDKKGKVDITTIYLKGGRKLDVFGAADEIAAVINKITKVGAL